MRTSKNINVIVDTARLPALPRLATLTRLARLPDVVLLGGLAAVATTVRFVASLPHTSPRYFPDEYLYPALAQSILHGKTEIRGAPARFPSMLESFVQAPLWLVHGVELPFRLVQFEHALIASLAAVPVYLIARHLGLPRWQRLSCGVVTLLLPTGLYASYLTADVLGSVLALASVAVACKVFARPSIRGEFAFLALAGLASFARAQYVVLLPAFLVTAFVMSSARPRRTVRSFPVTASLIAVGAVGSLALGPTRLLGYYAGLLEFDVTPGAMIRWTGSDLLLLALATGVVLAPAAASGLVAAMIRPRSPTERAIAVFSTAFGALILLEAVLYATNGSPRFQERYFMAVLPLVPVFACLGMLRAGARTARLGIVGVALALGIATMRTPLSDYVLEGNDQDSPTLQGVTWLTWELGRGGASLLIALAATAGLLFAIVAAWKPRRNAPTLLVVAGLVAAGWSYAAASVDWTETKVANRTALGSEWRWVDDAHLGDVSMVVPRDALRWVISQQLFWNRSVTDVLTLPGAPEADAFQNTAVKIDDRGVLRARGVAVTGPLLVQEYASSAQLDGADLVVRTTNSTLWRPTGTVRFVSLTDGRYLDGWLGWPFGMVTVWPGASGTRAGALCLPLSLPKSAGRSVTLKLWAPGFARTVSIRRGGSTLVAIPRVVHHAWPVHVMAKQPFRSGTRLLSVMVGHPVFVTGKASASACR